MLESKTALEGTPHKFSDITHFVKEKQAYYVSTQKLANLGYWASVVITARGGGKTYSSKKFMYDEFVKHGKRSVFLRNRIKDIEKEARTFLTEDCPPELKKNCKILGNADNGTLWVYYNDNGVWKPFIWMLALGTSSDSKGTRPLMDYVVMDEINVGLRDIANKYNDLFSDLIGSITDPKSKVVKPLQIIVFCNNKTLNHPFLVSLGITKADKDFSDYVDEYGNKMWCFFFEKVSDADREKFNNEHKNDATFQGMKLLNQADHMYFNDSRYDDPNWIYSYVDEEEYNPVKENKFFTNCFAINNDGTWVLIYDILKKNKLHTTHHVVDLGSLSAFARRYKWKDFNAMDFIPVDENGNKYFFYVKTPVESGNKLPEEVKKRLRLNLYLDQFSFETLSSRDNFLQIIK